MGWRKMVLPVKLLKCSLYHVRGMRSVLHLLVALGVNGCGVSQAACGCSSADEGCA